MGFANSKINLTGLEVNEVNDSRPPKGGVSRPPKGGAKLGRSVLRAGGGSGVAAMSEPPSEDGRAGCYYAASPMRPDLLTSFRYIPVSNTPKGMLKAACKPKGLPGKKRDKIQYSERNMPTRRKPSGEALVFDTQAPHQSTTGRGGVQTRKTRKGLKAEIAELMRKHQEQE